MKDLKTKFLILAIMLGIAFLCVRLASAAPAVESWVPDRVNSVHFKDCQDLLSGAGANSLTLVGSDIDSSGYYFFYQFTGAAFFVEAEGDSANFTIYAETCGPVGVTAGHTNQASVQDSLQVTAEGYYQFPVRAGINEYIRFFWRSWTPNGHGTEVKNMRLNRSWP
jgi:hypothetical protein